eukprot:gene45585-61104_t
MVVQPHAGCAAQCCVARQRPRHQRRGRYLSGSGKTYTMPDQLAQSLTGGGGGWFLVGHGQTFTVPDGLAGSLTGAP